MKWVQNRADRSSPPRIQANMTSYPAVYTEVYCPGEIYYLYILFSGILRGGSGVQQALIDGHLSHRAEQRNEPLNNLNENKIILSSNCW